MNTPYADRIRDLIAAIPLEIDPDIQVAGRPPTMASSQFLTNREQGDWAEEIIYNAINQHSADYRAVRYGRTESLPADHPDFRTHYAAYLTELNDLGKKPDLLLFPRTLASTDFGVALTEETIRKAVAAIEVRSSSFLAAKYAAFMAKRTASAESECQRLRRILLSEPYATPLRNKAPIIYDILKQATVDTFREIKFRATTWSSSQILRDLSCLLRELKEQIKILHKRNYLSITPKVEDLALVNRWIQKFGVPHYYLQVFFDKAYSISFERILRIVSDPDMEGESFSVEQDVKNQNKTTIKIDIGVSNEILGRIDFPKHESDVRELERGRLLFYVKFRGGRGYLDAKALKQEILSAR